MRRTVSLKGLEPSSTPAARSRLNSRLEWQGAEFLVLGHLLIEGLEAYKPYVNHPDYDLVAINPGSGKIARISVKSRWATNRAGHFSLASLNCDFVVHVALNRGERRRGQMISAQVQGANIYVLPVDLCTRVRSSSEKINIRNIPGFEQYESRWDRIQDFLKGKPK
jgi:hypothetical protein